MANAFPGKAPARQDPSELLLVINSSARVLLSKFKAVI